jgi:serine/threonine-protein kinase
VDGAFVGSPNYAAPETTLGGLPLDARSDIYSFGATAYHLLTGQPVFKDANPLKVIFAHASQVPASPSEFRNDIPAQLVAIVMKCLEKRPDDRFENVKLLDEALSRLQIDNHWTQQRAVEWWLGHGSSPQGLTVESMNTDTCLMSWATK